MNNLKSKDRDFRNMVDDPYLWHASQKNRNFCACGLNATGDPVVDPSQGTPIKAKVTNITALGYVKTGLALVGLYVIVTFVWTKWIKK